MDPERRRHRSERRDEALSLALAAAVERADAYAAVLADTDGLLVAGAGRHVDHTLLAALAPLALARSVEDPSGRAAWPVLVVPIQVWSTPLLCAFVGERPLDVRAVEAATARIVAGFYERSAA